MNESDVGEAEHVAEMNTMTVRLQSCRVDAV